MTQLLAAINELVTLQTAATSAPPTPLPVLTPLPFRAFNPDVECWPEYIAQLEAHFAAYNIPELEASRLPPPQPTTPPMAPLPRAHLPSSPLPVLSPAPDGSLLPPPRPQLWSPQPLPLPLPLPPCSSTVPEPMDAEAAVTLPLPPPPLMSPVEDVASPPHPGLPSGGARPGHVFHGAFSSPPREQFRVTGGQRAPAIPLSVLSAVLPLGPSTCRCKPYSTTVCRFRGEGCGIDSNDALVY
ncbi:uncharacterized protein LOC126474904 [Schistocerca serialis cubense]|uniref:uncharacterized protein LOC126474904 n=1 Tax=Schistocerca serialis cubense TaxID=2023355 RepID=UPI00214E0188|nr:uncharacterized protein LOC126474904 [Schistocerca serialis cubense]